MGRPEGTELDAYMPPSAGVRDTPDQGPAFPYYLSDRPRPGAPSMNGRGPQGPDTSLRPVGKVVTGGVMFGLIYGNAIWGKSVLSIARYPKATDLASLLEKVRDALTAWLRPRINKLSHDISKGSVHLNADLTHTLDLLALRMEQIVLNEAYIAADAAYTTRRLVHFKIPQIVQRYLRPLRLRIGRVERLTGRALLQIRALRTTLRRDIQRLQREQIDPLKKPVRVTLPGRIHRVETDVKTIKRTQARHTARLKQLTFILVPALASAWLIKTLIRSGLRFVTCQNVKDFGNELCASPPGTGRGLARFWRNFGSLLGDLAALSFVPLLLTDACRLMGVIEGLAIQAQPLIDDFVLGIEGFVCGGRESAPSGIVDSDYVRASSSLSGT
jgi:hypothetical protein